MRVQEKARPISLLKKRAFLHMHAVVMLGRQCQPRNADAYFSGCGNCAFVFQDVITGRSIAENHRIFAYPVAEYAKDFLATRCRSICGYSHFLAFVCNTCTYTNILVGNPALRAHCAMLARLPMIAFGNLSSWGIGMRRFSPMHDILSCLYKQYLGTHLAAHLAIE
jgi:hypothetical protein